MTKLGCCTFNFGPRTLDDSLRLVKDLGFGHVDVSAARVGEGAQVPQLEAAAHPRQAAKEIREAASRYGLELEELFITWIYVDGKPTDVNDPNAEARKKLLEVFQGLSACAAEAGFKSIMGVPGRPQEVLGEGGSWETSVETLGKMLEIARSAGVRFHVEPHHGSIAQIPELALKLVRDVPGLFYTLDYSHFIAQGIAHEEVARLHPYARHMHARQARRGQLACPVAQGEIDFPFVIKRLQSESWNGVIAMEYIVHEGPQGANAVFQNVVLAYQLEQLLGAKEGA